MSLLCQTLHVSMSGAYAWQRHPMSQHSREDGQLVECIQAAYHASRGVYGSLRIHTELQAQGITCARKRVARLMRAWELAARRPRLNNCIVSSNVRRLHESGSSSSLLSSSFWSPPKKMKF